MPTVTALLLDEDWQATDWGRSQTEQVSKLKRIDSVLEALAAAVKQAHERIIGERQVANNEKIDLEGHEILSI